MVYGIAMSPRTQAVINNMDASPRLPESSGIFGGVPVIVDPRLNDKSEFFYSQASWIDRLKEQNHWDGEGVE